HWASPLAVPAFDASRISAGDLDGDGHLDLVLTDFVMNLAGGGEASGAAKDSGRVVRILWGGPTAIDKSNRTELDVPYAAASAIGDLDADGVMDLAVAVHQTSESYAASSLVFFGQGQHRFQRAPAGVETEGAIGAAFVPAEKGIPARVVFCSS